MPNVIQINLLLCSPKLNSSPLQITTGIHSQCQSIKVSLSWRSCFWPSLHASTCCTNWNYSGCIQFWFWRSTPKVFEFQCRLL